MQEIFKCTGQYINLYSCSKGVQCSHKQELCDSVVFGILAQKLKQHELPLGSFGPISHSMEQIRAVLANIKFPEYIFLDKYIDGCCSDPQRCQCRGIYCQFCSKSLCLKCSRKYQKAQNINHAACSPLKGLQSKVQTIMQKVEGLELARFASKTSKDRPAAVWDSLNYT